MTGPTPRAPALRALVLFGGALGDTVAFLPALGELARRLGTPPEVRGDSDRLVLLDGLPERCPHGSIEGTGWHLLHERGADPARLCLSIACREVFVPATVRDEVLLENLRSLGAERVHPYRSLPDREEHVHLSDHYWFELLGLPGPAPAPRLDPPPEWLACAPRPDGPYWVLHPGSGSPAKNSPPCALAGLLERLASAPTRPVVIEGPADRQPVDALLELAARRGLPIPPVRRGMDVASLAGLLAGARAFLGHDSGPTHLAAALGVPTIALFRSTDPARWGPRGRRVRVIAGEPGVEEVATAIERKL
ncbi:MAG: glycosyltransferase family 9 protein [Planctomycetes bacterium]|nr:glycosyltransferase family 9 protein [Planctomycetota bacterium]